LIGEWGRVTIDPIIARIIPLKEYMHGFELMQKGDATKVTREINPKQ